MLVCYFLGRWSIIVLSLFEQIVRTHNGAMRILLVTDHSSLLTMCVTNWPESWTDSTLSAQAQSSPARTITSTYARHLCPGSLCRQVCISTELYLKYSWVLVFIKLYICFLQVAHLERSGHYLSVKDNQVREIETQIYRLGGGGPAYCTRVILSRNVYDHVHFLHYKNVGYSVALGPKRNNYCQPFTPVKHIL